MEIFEEEPGIMMGVEEGDRIPIFSASAVPREVVSKIVRPMATMSAVAPLTVAKASNGMRVRVNHSSHT